MVKALATKNVVAVLAAVALMASISFAFAAPAKADTVSSLQAQVAALLAQIQSLSGSTTTGTTGSTSMTAGCHTFTQNLKMNSTGGEVMWVQQFLNNHGFTIAATGAGSPGNETSHFGPATKAAVIKFQNANAAAILTPAGLTTGNGNWYAGTRAQANAMCAGKTTGTTGTGGTTVSTGPGITVSAAAQPTNSLAPMKATRVPFTTFTLTNNTSAAVTITGVTVQRTGLANDNSFAGVILVDASGMQYGNAQTFNSNHQATVGGTFTLAAGASMTYTVAGNMETTPLGNSGQVASVAVTGINTSVPVAGSLPITGAQQTINETLTIGTAIVNTSGFDPGSSRSEALGTTGLTFSAVHIQANNEDQKLFSITWNQTGSVGSTDLANLATVVNGTSYPVTVDASGKYFTSTFPGGILIAKGNSLDAYIKGDLTGSNAASRTVEFDVYRASDIYLVGQTYGYGITPTNTVSTNAYTVGSNAQSGFDQTINPFYYGATVTVTAGTLSTVSTASSVAPANIGVNVSNQTLGGFTTNFSGEPVTVQSILVSVATSSTGSSQLQNVTLVDSNGNVVAGPVDENLAAKTITFNSSVTFPVGAMTYVIKGTVATGALNGATYALTTDPHNWTGAVGQNSGSYVSLTDTNLNMSTMTVQPAALSISASASPAGTTVSTNQNNYVLANIVLDATQSGEDVRLNALPIVVSATSSAIAIELKSNLTGCQLFNGSTALNSTSIGSTQWGVITNTGNTYGANGVEANFVFDNSLTVPKSTTVTLVLQCNVGGSFTGTEGFTAGVSANYVPTVTGATSGNSVTVASGSLVVTSNSSGTMVIGNPTMAVTVPTPLSYSQVAGGTTGVTVGTFTLQPTSGAVNLTQVNLDLNGNFATPSDFQNGVVTIWNGSTQVGSVNFSGVAPSVTSFGSNHYQKLAYLSGVTIPQNVQTTLTLKADISPINNGSGTGKSGDEIRVSLLNTQGTSGNTQVNSGAGPAANTGVAIFASVPSVALVTLPSTGISTDGKMIAFSITAGSANPIGLGKLTFQITPGTNVTVTNPQLYAYQDSGFQTAAGGTNSGLVTKDGTNGAIDPGVITSTGAATTTKVGTPLEIPAGQTWYFYLKAQQTAYSGSNSTWSVGTTLNNDGTDLAPNMNTVSGLSGSNFVWSPNSKTTSAVGTSDWTSGFGVSGLSAGISLSRQN